MATRSSGRANRLARETSPYLLQHAQNPVDWYPWGPEALERARREDRPILLSIGYAACHWCHVMERESFQNEAIAETMNQHFVCVKVDREERPDLDDIYMAATLALSGSGGWPMTVFLTPDQRPFFAGTYFPPDDRYGRPGLSRLLARIAEAWREDRASLTRQADALTEHVRRQSRLSEPLSVGRDAMTLACEALWQSFDRELGGFGGAPKFPPAATLSFLLRHHRQTADLRALEMVVVTLNGMKNGGIYDHVGGGFARYSTDARWLVPHFEKMLYDNAQLAHVYAEAYQVTGRSEYGRVVTETLDYVIREMQGPDGGYFSATDADSEGEEGKFFVWTWDQIAELLDPPDAERFCAFYDITPEGNWEGKSVLNTPRSLAQVAADLGIEPAELAVTLERSRPLIHQARQRRVPPLLDDKVLTAHNGLMIGAMAFAAQVFGEASYLGSAARAADHAWRRLRRPDAGLYRTARGGTAHLSGYLEDYAYLCDGLITLYEAGGDPAVLQNALALGERIITDFGDARSGAFFHTAHDHELLIARTREGHDGALPNPNSVAARALLRLGRHFGREPLVERARAALCAYGTEIARLPRAFMSALSVVDMALEAPLELVTVGPFGDPRTRALNAVIAASYLPSKVQAHVDPERADTKELSPLTRDKPLLGGAPAVYVCENFSCKAPRSDPEQLRQELDSALQARRGRRAQELSHTALSGAATPDATRRFVSKSRERGSQALGASSYRELASTGILVSQLGFGAYRLAASEAHADALRFAIQQGINLIDTAGSYGEGDSERVIGQTLLELSERGVLSRDEVVVVTKLGDLRGAVLADHRRREQQGHPLVGVVKHAPELWHCVHPEFLEEQLERSLERLGLASVDVCLLQNPEYYLETNASGGMPLSERRQELYRRIEQAFGFFERARSAGKLEYYGVSSNTLGRAADDPRALDAARLLAAAERAVGAGQPHHFRVLELPLNLLEPGAAVLQNTGDPARLSVLEFARQRQLALLANRPLSAWVGGGLERLVDPDLSDSAPPLEAALSSVAGLEAQFRRQFAAQLRAPEGALPAATLFDWAERLRRVASELESLPELEELHRVVLQPQLEQTLQSLDRAFGASHPAWAAWRDQYLAAMQVLLDSLRRRAAERSARTLAGLRERLAPFWTSDLRDTPTSQLALAALGQLPGVTSVLVGMHQRPYVEAALGSLRAPCSNDIQAAFAALFSQAPEAARKS